MSSKVAPCQLLIDPPADGAWNMAVDEVLLSTVAKTGVAALRFYQWKRPTLSLGYFQKATDRAMHPQSLAADLVRRLSGGGAILHDQELTYSLILPASHVLALETQTLYNIVHEAILQALRTFLDSAKSSWYPELRDEPSGLAAQEEPFLCFQRRSLGDIVLRNEEADASAMKPKIVGSAQRRRRGTVLQHGSILLNQSKLSTELAGIAETTNVKISSADLLSHLPYQLATSLALELEDRKLTGQLSDQIRELQSVKYQAASWTERR